MEARQAARGSIGRPTEPWRRIAPGYRWEDLVLPGRERELFRSLRAKVRRRRATRVGGEVPPTETRRRTLLLLFIGAAGTGKTMTAQIIGAELGMPVFEVNLAKLVRQRQREREQIIAEVFAAAATENAIVFFDRADAYLGRRSAGAHPRDGAADAALDLLERSKRHRGVVIFASLKGGIDDSLAPRFRSVLRFPFPDSEGRKEIWRRLLPADAEVNDAELDYVAKSFKLPGGAIRGCCRQAAVAAQEAGTPVRMPHVAGALQTEYRVRLASESTARALATLLAGRRDGAPLAEEEPLAVAPPAPQGGLPSPPGTAHRWRERADQWRAELLRRLPRWAAAPRPASRPRRWTLPSRKWSAVIASCATAVAAALGFVAAQSISGQSSLAGQSSLPALAQHATAGSVQVSYPVGWRRQAAPAVGLSNQLAVAPGAGGGGMLVIGTTPSSGAELLPQPLLAALPKPPAAQVATLGALRFYHYQNHVPPGQASESVYALPTTVGTVVGVCRVTSGNPGLTNGCERVLGTVKLTSGSVIPATVSPTYAQALNHVLADLNAVRARAGSQLGSARDAQVQASAATQLANAHVKAAAALSKLDAGPAAAANAALASALRITAFVYGTLAQAVENNDARGYSEARNSLSLAARSMSSAFAALSERGYPVS